MASGRQRRKIGKKKKVRKRRKEKMTRVATTCKKIGSPAARTGSGNWPVAAAARKPEQRQEDTVDEAAAAPPVKETCSVCEGGRGHHSESFCPYNYVDGRLGVRTCKERCRPGRHPLHEAVRRFVRVSNVPLDLVPGVRELRALFEQFGPLLKCTLTRVTIWDRIGFGYAVFKDREHAEAAVDGLNGHRVGDHRLRVDWAYPRA